MRTSFVAIQEKDGRIGLKRDTSGESSISRRRMSMDTEGIETPSASLQERNVFAEEMGRVISRTNLSKETIPESPRQDKDATPVKQAAPAPVKKWGSSFEGAAASLGKVTSAEDKAYKPLASEPLVKDAPKSNGTPATNGATAVKKTDEPKPATPVSTKLSAKPIPTLAPKTSFSKLNSAAKSTAQAKSPTTTKPAVTASTPSSSRAQPSSTTAKLPTKTPERKATTAAPASATSTPAKLTSTPSMTTTPSSLSKRPHPHLPAGSTVTTGGFVKLKPKSPTRPVRLPAGLVAQTASSVSKLKEPASRSASAMGGRAPSRMAGGGGNYPTAAAAFLAAGGADQGGRRVSGGSTGGSLRRQSSVVGRPRPAIGPPPRQVSRDHPPTRHEVAAMHRAESGGRAVAGGGHVDNGFLVRMMRPTQSSEAKVRAESFVHHPVVLATPASTPPRKQALLREGSVKKATAVKKEPAPKREEAPPTPPPVEVKRAPEEPAPPAPVSVKAASPAAELTPVLVAAATPPKSEPDVDARVPASSSPVASAHADDDAPAKAESMSDTTAVELEMDGVTKPAGEAATGAAATAGEHVE